MITTGMRPGEAAKLRVGDIDIKKRSIWLDETKKDDLIMVPLTKAAFKEIAIHVIGRGPDAYVFHHSNPLPPNYQKHRRVCSVIVEDTELMSDISA